MRGIPTRNTPQNIDGILKKDQRFSFSNCSIMAEGIRPRSLSSIPFSRAQRRTRTLFASASPHGVLRRLLRRPPTLRAAEIHGSMSRSNCSAFWSERSISYDTPLNANEIVCLATEPSRSSTNTTTFFCTVFTLRKHVNHREEFFFCDRVMHLSKPRYHIFDINY